MNKTELIDAIATKAGVSKKDSAAALNAFIEVTTKELSKGGAVAIPGFGSFKVSKRAARNGRNPQTGATIKIAATKVPKFSAGKSLKDAVAKKKK